MLILKLHIFIILAVLITIVNYSQDRDKRKLVSGGILMVTLTSYYIALYIDNAYSYLIFIFALLINVVNVISLFKRNNKKANIKEKP